MDTRYSYDVFTWRYLSLGNGSVFPGGQRLDDAGIILRVPCYYYFHPAGIHKKGDTGKPRITDELWFFLQIRKHDKKINDLYAI